MSLMFLLLIPLIGCLFGLISKKSAVNVWMVTLFTLGTSILYVLYLFSKINLNEYGLFFSSSYYWWGDEKIKLSLGVDVFSLFLLLSVYISIFIGLMGLSEISKKNKLLMISCLIFVWAITGFFIVTDMVSFYIFFTCMLLPLYMMNVTCGNVKKSPVLLRFFIFNFVGVLFLLSAILILFKFYNENVLLEKIALIDLPENVGLYVWSSICIAFISRIPVWPFHYWISAISTGTKNSLVYVITNLLPLSGLYAFVRFWPVSVPEAIDAFMPVVETFCIMTMMFIALIGVAHKDFLYKLFSYSTIYYLLFLLAVVLPTDTLKMNIVYSLFTFLIVNSSLVVLDLQLELECEENRCDYRGILAYMPKLSKIFVIFLLIAVGLPLSSLFWNNFILISAIFKESFLTAVWVMGAITLISVSLIYELYVMKDLQNYSENALSVEDLYGWKLVFFIIIITILFLSFFNPLWFIV